MKKLLVLALLTALLALALTACADMLPGGTSATTAPAEATTAPEATVTEAPTDAPAEATAEATATPAA